MQPIGRLWLNALQMTVVPLVTALIVLGVSTASDAASSGRIAQRAIVAFIVLLSVGAAFAVRSRRATVDGAARSRAHRFAARVCRTGTPLSAPAGLADWISAIVPSNAISAAAQSAMLPLVVFALFFGFALTRIERERRARIVDLFQAIADAMIVIVRWVCGLRRWASLRSCWRFAHAGVEHPERARLLHRAAVLRVSRRDAHPLRRRRDRRRRILAPLRAAILPAQVIAASTQSSLASLPAMIESAQTRLGYPRAVSALVLPMAVSLFRMTSPIQYLNAADVHRVGVWHRSQSSAQLAAGAALAVVMSLGSVGLPGQVSFMATSCRSPSRWVCQ